MMGIQRLVGVVLCLLVFAAATARADSPRSGDDAVVHWNMVATDTLVTAGAAPARFVDMAMVHAAMHDAVQSIQGRYATYNSVEPGGGSRAAAAATAAYTVLKHRYPNQEPTLTQKYVAYLAAAGLHPDSPGTETGRRAGEAMINSRLNTGEDRTASGGLNNTPTWNGGTNPSEWRPTPPGFLSMATPWLGTMTPFVLETSAHFLPGPPPSLTSEEYTRDYNEVKSLGPATGSTRTTDQTHIAFFYSDNGLLYWHRALRRISTEHRLKIGESARLFALVTLAQADAVMTAWRTKSTYNFWRPITAIRNDDGNPDTVADAGWTPLITTPNYPDYTSGANNVGGAATRMLALFFGTDEVTFTIESRATQFATPQFLTYQRFSDAAADIVEARIYEGIHFRFADVIARTQGTNVADWVFTNALQQTGEGVE